MAAERRPGRRYSVLFRFCVLVVAGWIRRGQQNAIEYLIAENRVLREQLGGQRLARSSPRLPAPRRARAPIPSGEIFNDSRPEERSSQSVRTPRVKAVSAREKCSGTTA